MMMYKHLGSKASIFQIRIVVSFLIIAGFVLIGSYFLSKEKDIELLILGLIIFIWAYFSARFCNIKYTSEAIVVQNFLGSNYYLKSDFVRIKPLRRYLNFYVIVFKNNRSYLFGLASSKIFLTNNATENAREMEKELLSN